MADAKTCHALTTYYLNGYQGKYGQKPVVNRNKARWGFDSVLEDLKPAAVMKLIDFYFSTSSTTRHSLEWFFYNYDKLIEKKAEYDRDEADRKKLREESRLRVEEWRQSRRGNTRGENSGSSLSE